MFEGLEILRLAGGMSRHAAARQVEVARNVANADTPGYRAQDLVPFEQVFSGPGPMALQTTRAGHVSGSAAMPAFATVDAPDAQSPNGNTVSLEDQMLKATEVRHAHDVALAVYSTTLGILRTSIGKR